MHVLFVEDNYVNQRLGSRVLEKFGCTVAVAGDGQQALNYLAGPPATCPRPDIILMDISMPVMCGFEATRIIRSQPPFNTDPKICMTPIVGMSASALKSDYERCVAQGMDDLVRKPLKQAHLRQLLLWWSHRQVLPRTGGGELPQIAMFARWGIQALRAYRGPRSIL